MLLTIFSNFFIVGLDVTVNASPEEEYEISSLRLYGGENAIYPTHSYTGSDDFVYLEEYDAFDPGIIEKDSITFNSAFLHGHEDYEIKAQGDASEKIFLRAFYEPGYTHGVDTHLSSYSSVLLEPVEPFDAIVTETTYFLTTLDKSEPLYGYPGTTSFFFPFMSIDTEKPGMEYGDLVDVVASDSMQTMQLTDGAVAIEETFVFDHSTPYVGETIAFLDHEIRIQNFEQNDPFLDKLDIKVSYIGNMHDSLTSSDVYTLIENQWDCNHFFDRENSLQMNSDPAYRWYLRVESADDDYLRIVLGRWLYAGETFYVDGVRYDMPAVYVDSNGGFKYITLQSPLPKGDTVWNSRITRNVDDWSHVTSQYLASLPYGDCVWMLPPFNEPHKMIDDIGLKKEFTGQGCCYRIPEDGLLINCERPPLCFFYVEETIEPRFDSSIAERLNTTCSDTGEPEEVWEWYNVFIRPNQYTAFALPDQETYGVDSYDPLDRPSWYPFTKVDGNEYLITSSFLAPNSNVDTNRNDACKTYNTHEIYDRVRDIAIGVDDYKQANTTYLQPRLVYAYDALNTNDFYINEYSPRPSIRIYGEEHACYPSQSSYASNDFIYPVESDAFDPGVVVKDSITFNPAVLYGHEEYEIKAQGDASEKIFFRFFYEPGYTHAVDYLMNTYSNVILHPVETFDSITTETSYMLTTFDKSKPVVGYPGATSFVFPYQSTDEHLPGMDYADLIKVVETDNGGTVQLTDGGIKVEKQFEFNNIDYTEDMTISFLDHKVTIKNFENREPWDKIDLDVGYIGNMYEAASSIDTHTIWEDSWNINPSFEYYYDRDNAQKTSCDPAYRWYLRVESADDDYLRIVLGRWLYAGETFYVDGVRYDMPAIYVDEQGGFKYITLQSPIPKGETIWDHQLTHNVDDWSHVTSQYLASIPAEQNTC